MFEHLYELGRNALNMAKSAENLNLDSATTSTEPLSLSKSAVFQEQAIVSEALSKFSAWLETDETDLDEGEGLGDRLMALMVSVADANKNGEIDEDEAEIINIGLNGVADYMIAKGVSEENAVALLEGFDNDIAENVRDILLGVLPDGDEALWDEMDNIIFSDEDNESVFDSVQGEAMLKTLAREKNITLDAAYRKVFAVRNGKKMRINKRISGNVRLTAAQKTAIRKAQMKSNTGAAKMRRLKSFKLRKRLGL